MLLTTVEEIYFVGTATRHMATMGRICNNIGPIKRDLAEGNTDSVGFPGFDKTDSASSKKCAPGELAAYKHYHLMQAIG